MIVRSEDSLTISAVKSKRSCVNLSVRTIALLTLLYSEWPKLGGVLAFLSAVGLMAPSPFNSKDSFMILLAEPKIHVPYHQVQLFEPKIH